ncbi:FBP C-terminal treble-clef zinc-finger [Paramicrobacterium humi]|uniref:FBP C-terminal treble-clef zinc-finger n=1 Tax=Paramicrobacterium humi TaxID=640635 RepID=A0A1H4LRL6_9MICO|nr:FBP domain-containing protein [Microbacterium humi]SEB73390.1 FBP C-terminal treble-clef zinc-finger [Microbacterium humi]
MLSLTEKQIRASFINASVRERSALTLPANFDDLDWDALDFLGWRDPKLPKVGYVVAVLDGQPVGIMLKQAEAKTRTRPQCSWCEDVHLPNDVVFYSAKRAGQSGRNGNTVGTLVCANFECSANARRRPPTAYIGFDVEAARQRQIEALRANVGNFLRDIRDKS